MKGEQILEAAIKRFSHFGIQKTTMTEIADDLSISKQALFYYYPDKPGLIAAVEEKIIGEYISALEKVCAGTERVEMALQKMIDTKAHFFQKYYMLAVQIEWAGTTAIATATAGVRQKLRTKELALLAALFEQGAASGEIKPVDGVKTGNLLLDTVTALAHGIGGHCIIPDPQSFQQVCIKQKEVIRLLYNGLKN